MEELKKMSRKYKLEERVYTQNVILRKGESIHVVS